MVKTEFGARTLILSGTSWTAFDAQGQPWPEGAKFAEGMTKRELFHSQEPDPELARANRITQKVGGQIVLHIPNLGRTPFDAPHLIF